jgi:peptidoglycan/LPS O-acetylase OafA/YrhL
MENRKSQGMENPKSNREAGPAARPPAVTATLAALLLLTVSIVGQITAGADYPAVPPGVVIPLVVGGLLLWRTNRWTSGLALAVGLLIGIGALLTPNTGDHLSSGDAALLTATVAEMVALAGLVVAGAAATLRGAGSRS